MTIRKHVAVGATTLLTASAMSVAVAAPSSAAPAPEPAPSPCGYYEVGNEVWHSSHYNHCGKRPIWVYVDAIVDYQLCLRPGDYELNSARDNAFMHIDFAYSNGVC